MSSNGVEKEIVSPQSKEMDSPRSKELDSDIDKSPIEPGDYAGLQLDTRAQSHHEAEDTQPDSLTKSASYTQTQAPPRLQNEKALLNGIGEEGGPPPAPSYEAPILRLDPTMKETVQRKGQVTTGGVSVTRRTKLLILGAIILAIVIIAAVVGGVVGSRNASASNSSGSSAAISPTSPTSSAPPTATTSTLPPDIINAQLPKNDIMVASPLSSVAFTGTSSQTQANQSSQNYLLFYQSASGNVKEMMNEGTGVNENWSPGNPIFTDAMNNTGLASFSYLNGSKTQTSLFYTGADGTVWEKRNYPNLTYWDLGSVVQLHALVSGNSSFESPSGGWNGFRMAAVYSTNFSTGAGGRVFYHANETTIQELIWHHRNDSWTLGSRINGVDPISHFAVTIEPDTQVLRLFYCSSNGSLQESWLNITDGNATYETGISALSILAHSNSDIAVVSNRNGTYVYYPSQDTPSSNITIRELFLGSRESNESVSSVSNSATVVVPDLVADDSGQVVPSLFCPLSATVSTVDNGETITVFWADGIVDAESGYSAMWSTSRPVDGQWDTGSPGNPRNRVSLPLGENNADPH